MKKAKHTFLMAAAFLALVNCSPKSAEPTGLSDGKDPRLVGDATLTVSGLPEGAKVVSVVWFEGRDDDHFQGEIYDYSDGMTIPAGKLMFLIEGKGYEPLMARRIPVFGDTILEARMCKIDEGCHGTLERVK
ncbi:MAG: hypothetical protein NXH70_11870 [Hyphomonas sp.]|nr:hypothetical protein [Hyphomonas sp.]